ncbi:MAG: ATP-binding protein [bacterium]
MWDRRSLREIYRSLLSLNSPFNNKNDSFRVEVTSDSDIFEKMPIFSDINKNALYFCKSSLEKDKIVDFKYEFKPWNTLTKIQHGRIKNINDLLKHELIIIDDEKEKKLINLEEYKIGPIEFELIIFEKDPQIFNYALSERTTTTDYLKHNGGIRVYRDGIRVYDYGERDNDWLGIDLRRVSLTGGRVSNSIIIGAIQINRKDSIGLREKTNREGFIENESYKVFVQAINYVLNIFVRERNIDKQKLTTLYKKHKVIEPVLSDLDEVISIAEQKINDIEIKNDILKYLYRISEQYKSVKEILLKSANAGLNFGIVIHEMEKLVAELSGTITRKEYSKTLNITTMLEKIVRGYMILIKNSSIMKNRLSDIVQIALDNFEFRFKDHNINVITNHKKINYTAYLAQSESISAILNLLDNSIYWLSYRDNDRKIYLYLTDQINDFYTILVIDNGPGFNIPSDIAIEPFITGKPHNIGSGLGLHVANEMMKAMKGELRILSKNDIRIPDNIIDIDNDYTLVGLCFKREK